MSDITEIPTYTGVVPNKDTQSQSTFDGAADTWLAYQNDELVPAINAFGPEVEALSTEVQADATAATTAASNSSSSAASSSNSANSAAASAESAGTALASANAILGLGIGTSTIDSSGHLIMTYDDGTLAEPPELNASGHLILTV